MENRGRTAVSRLRRGKTSRLGVEERAAILKQVLSSKRIRSLRSVPSRLQAADPGRLLPALHRITGTGQRKGHLLAGGISSARRPCAS